MAVLRVENLSFTYPQCEKPVLQDISFAVEPGDFVTVCGATGSGKTTLLRLLKRELAPLGTRMGSITLNGTLQEELPEREAAYAIGYVMQRPEQQIVTDYVWHELAFGLENMGLEQSAIARRVAEMAAYFDMEDWYDKPVSTLSGGQKQLLNLAAVMVMNPSVLILDEPTAQLDPIAASDFIATIHKLNRELGLTVLMIEHRLEEVIPISDRLLVLDGGKLLCEGKPAEVIVSLVGRKDLLRAMPAAVRLYHALGAQGECPLDVRGGRRYIQARYENKVRSLPAQQQTDHNQPALELKDVCFRYERSGQDVLRSLDLTVYTGEVLCILGGNGSGKSTTMSAAAGLIKPYHGKISVFGKPLKDYRNQTLYRECLTLLPQDVQTVFLKNTVKEELAESGVNETELPYGVSHLHTRHPYDLSGGEQQLVALAKVLATKPKLLLLDEPTKGVDADTKALLAQTVRSLKERGVTVVIVTHDVEFAADCADRCAFMFRGNVVSMGTPEVFFAENSFYTTAVSRMTRGYYDGAVTVEAAAKLCLLNGGKDGGK